MNLLEKELVYKINGCIFEVYKELGHSFAEKVYENALMYEFEQNGIPASSQVKTDIFYKDIKISEYICDIVVDNKVILELKAQENISTMWQTQLLNYLKATRIRVGLLVNFIYPKADVQRFIL